MLDVLSRSQRSRVCEYTRNEVKLTTPSMIGSVDNGVAWIEAKGDSRMLHFMGTDVMMESGLRTTSNSGMESEMEVKDGIAVIRLPVKEGL